MKNVYFFEHLNIFKYMECDSEVLCGAENAPFSMLLHSHTITSEIHGKSNAFYLP
jgi:hypothetical protein